MPAPSAYRDIPAASLDTGAGYRLVTSCVVPRPIAWVSTVDAAGRPNLAPFSYFAGVSSNPPMISIAIGRRRGEKKDTWRNLEEVPELVVNVVPAALGEAMALTSGDYPRGESEFAVAGLTPLPSVTVRPPRVAESPIQLECRVERTLEVGRNPDLLVVAQIVRFHLREDILTDGLPDAAKLDALGRLSASLYCRTTDLVSHPRP